MWIGLDKVSCKYAGKELWRSDGVLFGFDVDSVFHGIGGYYDAIICLGVSERWLAGRCSIGWNTYEISMAPSNSTQTVISVTVCTPVFSSL